MVLSFIHVVLAALGLGLLIFIHELGHYWMARKQGMTVEVFSIGFGKPLYTWMCQGVKWQFCWLPFGGYVRIAGMEKRGALEPHQIPDGFFGKKPLARIKVAIMGPLVNLVFAFLLFSVLWFSGGRAKSFSQYTHLIGWVDTCSDLYEDKVRAGDEITRLNGKPFNQFQDLVYAAMLDDAAPVIDGEQIDYLEGGQAPFHYAFSDVQSLKGIERVKGISAILAPAEFLVYAPIKGKRENPLATGSPMQESGIAYGDRIIWVDGNLIFSLKQLISTINEPATLLTVKRGTETLLARIPRLKVGDLRLSMLDRAELDDWQNDAKLSGKLQDLYFIPYSLNGRAVVQGTMTYFSSDTRETRPCAIFRTSFDTPLLPGDQITAVDGKPIGSALEFFQQVQTHQVHIIVKSGESVAPIAWKSADAVYRQDIDWQALEQMIQSVGSSAPLAQSGNLRLLQPVTPRPLLDLPLSQEIRAQIAHSIEEQKRAIEALENPQERAEALRVLEEGQKQLKLGIQLQDRDVTYNPSPFALFYSVFQETWRTLVALFTGYLSPKWLAGPVGMVQVMQSSWAVGVKEAIFWLAVISLNLGLLNLLPIPVLDGGHICFSIWEGITGKPIKARTMERLILPFILLLVALFVYLTYHDLMRLITRFW